MKKAEKLLTAAVIAVVCGGILAFLVYASLSLFGNPLDRIKVRAAAEEYIAENYSEMKPQIVDIDFDWKYIGYWVEIFLEENGKTFSLQYYESGELEWDTYDFSIYEKKYGETYYEEGIYGIRDIIGIPQNEKQKAVLAVINFDFEIQNGGLAQYLINEENEYIEKIVDYLRMLGAEEYATLLETFMTENDIEFKSVETNSIEESIEFEKSKPFDEFIRAYADIENKSDFSNDITPYVVSYIQENIEDF